MPRAIKLPAAKAKVLDRLAAGEQVAAAMKSVGRSYETYRDWRKTDPEFRAKVARIREGLKRGDVGTAIVPDFPEFSAEYLNTPLPEHHLRAWDVLNGRDPRNWHESIIHQRSGMGTANTIINFAPNHGKTTTWSMNYVAWRIYKDPTIRIILVSQTQRMARDMLLAVKQRLTNPLYEDAIAKFAPAGGWKQEDLPWRENQIFVRGRDAGEKDPTLQALGIGGQIYGSRADLIILDDIEDLSNYGQFEQHAKWIARECDSRLDHGGQLLVLGTRVGPEDVYRHLRDKAKTLDDKPAWNYLGQPAILENASDPDPNSWVVIWPEERPPEFIARKRANYTDPRQFDLVYQLSDISEDAVFHPVAVDASINRRRQPGPMTPGVTGHRDRGMHGLYVVAGWDPASSAGRNAMTVIGVDEKHKRWVLDVWNKKGATPRMCIDKLKEWTTRFSVNEWRIENNALQAFITQLDEIQKFLMARGVLLRPVHTGSNKWAAETGVEATAELFNSCIEWLDGRPIPLADGAGMIELPMTARSPGAAELVSQLKSWDPSNRRATIDCVMAFWFAMKGIQDYVRRGMNSQTHLKSRFMTRQQLSKQKVAPSGRMLNAVR